MLWTVAPVFLLAAIGVFVFWELPGIADAPKASAADSTTIQIEGHQYYWLFRYPNGAISIDRMIAPANQVVHEEVIGLDFDVNHSWWIPDLGGKYDAIPGKTNKTWFKAPVGTYVARCSELCGLQHALMTATVDVVPRAEYDKFISTRASSAGQAALGKEEFTGVCEKCHRLDQVYVGPALGGNSLLANRKGIESLLRNGEGQMPPSPRTGRARRSTPSSRTPSNSRRRVAGLMAVNVEAAPPYRADWRNGKVASLADDGRPQADRDPLHLDVAGLLRRRRDPRAG